MTLFTIDTCYVFCYVDESGDCGKFDPSATHTGTPYFIVAGIFLDTGKWKSTLDTLKGFRKKIAREGFLNYDVEFHCAEMVDPRKVKAFTSISVSDRWALIEEYAGMIGGHSSFQIIAVVIDKVKSSLEQSEYLTSAITALYKSFDEFLLDKQSYGLMFLDRANEKKIQTHVRMLLGTGSGYGKTSPVKIVRVLEDPIFKVSHDSF